VRGPIETNITTTNEENYSMDVPNHSLSMMMPATAEVLKYFKRYSKFYIQPLKEGD
jgi:hypothetical protein